ncbi:xanthan lyase [candidate division KSB1 bacterium]|nr:xanthan lyase [candidate division KSB1 bacterium]
MKDKHQNIIWILYAVIVGASLWAGCGPQLSKHYDYTGMDKQTLDVHLKTEQFLRVCIQTGSPLQLSPAVRIDSIFVNANQETIEIFFNKVFSYPPFRPENTQNAYTVLREILGRKYRDFSLNMYSLDVPIQQLVPNLYRDAMMPIDSTRMARVPELKVKPLVRRISRPLNISQGLQDQHLALWHSHGWYYSHNKHRWEWQRPRLFQTVEDLLPLSFVLPFLTPMLENAGATVFLPRERDWQIHWAIVDNDKPDTDPNSRYLETSGSWIQGNQTGFAVGDTPYVGNENPFQQGSYRVALIDSAERPRAEWIPDIPAKGDYAVYVSYHPSEQNVDDAQYTIHHLGGQTKFLVNQQIGGKTWVFLGRFRFPRGVNPDSAKVVLTPGSHKTGQLLSADAVRFGGGMGVIARGGRTSDRPRFMEAARYYLQASGMPDSLVWNLNENDDYRDDYQSRGEWVNYLKGKPFGPNKKRDVDGLGIPIDLSMAMHTDAGITRNDTTVGTLSIYSLEGADTTIFFPDGQSRLANRDLADIMQTSIVRDLQALYDSTWSRRQLMDGQYSEAYRPNVPAVLVELLSHQNYLDMQFALDPRFRFDVSRAMYKAILKFASFQHQDEYIVQPLPVDHFAARFNDAGNLVLEWQPRKDPLEPTATPEEYIVYTRIEDGGFDNGQIAREPRMIFNDLEPGKIYSFRVTAANRGGESFPSETLSVCRFESNPEVLIVNGFDRVSGPLRVESDQIMGFIDQGVAAYWDLGYTGMQWDYNPDSKFISNDAPGHGASYADYETRILAGNDFDYPFIHGKALRANGQGFVSMSDEVFMKLDSVSLDYSLIDLILGEERATPVRNRLVDSVEFKAFPVSLIERLRWAAQQNIDLFISGAYVGSELYGDQNKDSTVAEFAHSVLKIEWATPRAAGRGKIFSVDPEFLPVKTEMVYNAGQDLDIYPVEAPDALEPAKKSQAKAILRFSENEFGAAIGYQGEYSSVVMSIPFESIILENERNQLMGAVLNFFVMSGQ